MEVNDLFTEQEKINLAEISSTFSSTVNDRETFEDFLHTLQLALTHEEATKLLAMSAAVIASMTNTVISRAAEMFIQFRADQN